MQAEDVRKLMERSEGKETEPKDKEAALLSVQAAHGIRGSRIHSSSYASVCQVKCTLNYKWCTQKL